MENENKTASPACADLRALILQKRYGELTSHAHKVREELFLEWLDGVGEEFRRHLRHQSALLDDIPGLVRPDEAGFAFLQLGRLMGTVEAFERIRYEARQDRWARDRLREAGASSGHASRIARALEDGGPMTRRELGRSLDMDAAALAEALEKMLEAGAVRAGGCGRHEAYALTDAGLRYARDLRKREASEAGTDHDAGAGTEAAAYAARIGGTSGALARKPRGASRARARK